MTHIIASSLTTPALPDTQAGTPQRAATLPTQPATGAEAVTLSADAQTTTQLLDAARLADGSSPAAIAQARGAIQSNSYSVPPEDLATAIAAALKDRQA